MIEINCKQGSSEWHQQRHGRVTGSTLFRAVGSKQVQDTFLCELVSERMTECDIFELHTPAIDRGNDMEPVAIARASKDTGKKFEIAGFLQSETWESFGMSPDGVHREGITIIGGIETKCPNSKNHIQYLMKNEVPPVYIDQVYSPFLVSDDIKWWYFMSFDDRVKDRSTFYYKVIREDIEEELEKMSYKLGVFLGRVKEAHNLIMKR